MSMAPVESIITGCNEAKRLEALRSYGILDTPAEREFDDITRLAALICQVPIALISFVETERQWFKSEVGLNVRQTPADISVCSHTLREEDALVVPDLLADARFANNPLVIGEPYIRFYAGMLLRSHDGHALGTLCVLDYQPRHLSNAQLDALSALRRQVMAQLELRRTKEEAEAANSAKDRFLAFLSHELRTPLSPALLTASALERNEAAPQWVREDAGVIRKSIEVQTSMIDGLLDVTRIAHGKLELKLQSVHVPVILTDSIRACASEAAAKHISVGVEACDEQHPVRADGAKLQQVVCNLLKNAIKFTPEYGKVMVRCTSSDDQRVRIEVSDTGVGIEPERLHQVFQPFEQGDRSVTRRFGGLGLGLAICKGIVDAHGGTIKAASDGPGQGTTVSIELPATTIKPKLPEAASPQKGGTDPGLRILLVDDHEDTLRVMARLLKHLSHKVTTADGVHSALAAAHAGEFDLLISDVGLPDGTGLELMEQLLAQRPIKGIALTGYGTESDIQKTRAAGFMAHLTKPIDFKQLQDVIHQTRSRD